MNYRPNETVYCRFSGMPLIVVACNGNVADVHHIGRGDLKFPMPVGDLTREDPEPRTAAGSLD